MADPGPRPWRNVVLYDADGVPISGTNPLPVSGAAGPGSPVEVEGNVAHDTPDDDPNKPVAVGGHANASPPVAVTENDRVRNSLSLFGQLRVLVSGVAAGIARDVLIGLPEDITESSIVLSVHDPLAGVSDGAAVVTDANGNLQQYLRGLVSRASTAAQGLFVVGNVAHDTADSNNPVGVGLNAQDPTALPANVSVADRVRAIASQKGEILAYLSRLISGEDQSNFLLQVAAKRIQSATYAPSEFTQLGTFGATGEAAVGTAATPGNVYAVKARNKSTSSARYLYLKNKASSISGSDPPTHWFLVPPNSEIVIGEDVFGQFGVNYSAGIRVGWSSTENTFTAVNEDVTVFVHYKQ